MVRNKKKIIVVGGGGFTHKSDKDLDDFVINQVNKSNIDIGSPGCLYLVLFPGQNPMTGAP